MFIAEASICMASVVLTADCIGTKAITIKALRPIAASWAAPGDFFVSLP